MKRRITFLLALLLLMCPLGICLAVQGAVACVLWITRGPDEARTDRILERAPAAWFMTALDRLAAKAGIYC
jgi:uncharacterized iron-regulated membrane protein